MPLYHFRETKREKSLRRESAQEQNRTGVVNSGSDYLNVRSGPGTNNTIVGYLYYGTKVQILETKTASDGQWGRISNGWISMNYAK